MRKHILLLITLLATLEVTAQNSENFYFSNLNLKDGLSQISVLKIFQDTKGFIWFGTRNGLNRYDGSEFVIYKHDPKDSLTLVIIISGVWPKITTAICGLVRHAD